MVRISASWLLLLIVVAGCGSDYETVRGTVTLDGAPLANCEVVFSPVEGGRPAAATTDEDGQYDLASSMSQKGILPGKYTVHLATSEEEEDEDGRTTTTEELVPAAYRGENAPEVEVTKSGGRFDFELKSGGA
jgi:hypothetical protein